MKSCKDCGKPFDVNNFYVSYVYNGHKVFRSECKDCNIKRSIKWGKNNKSKRHYNSIKCLYGISKEEYDRILFEQNAKCKICKLDNPGHKLQKRFNIDHDHKTGKVRGLLCQKCNIGIGAFKDSCEILESALKYLKES
jgi:hypothetical protein